MRKLAELLERLKGHRSFPMLWSTSQKSAPCYLQPPLKLSITTLSSRLPRRLNISFEIVPACSATSQALIVCPLSCPISTAILPCNTSDTSVPSIIFHPAGTGSRRSGTPGRRRAGGRPPPRYLPDRPPSEGSAGTAGGGPAPSAAQRRTADTSPPPWPR